MLNHTNPLQQIPTLDALVQAPGLVASLPLDVVADLLPQVMALEGQLTVRLLTSRSVDGSASRPTGDMLIGVHEVAAMIGMSVSWVEKHAKVLPQRVSIEGNPRWRRSEVQQWVKTRPLYGGSLDKGHTSEY